jgi:DICT domain-containing protein
MTTSAMTTLTFRSSTSSPYAVLADRLDARPRQQSKRSLLSMSRLAEAQTLSSPIGAVILAVLQENRHFTPRTEQRYRALADRGVQVVLFAHGWTGLTEVAPGLRLAGLDSDDAVRNEWDLLVCSSRRRFGFVSQDLQDGAAGEMERTFGWLTTSDADALGRAADALLMRVPGSGLRIPPLVA